MGEDRELDVHFEVRKNSLECVGCLYHFLSKGESLFGKRAVTHLGEEGMR